MVPMQILKGSQHSVRQKSNTLTVINNQFSFDVNEIIIDTGVRFGEDLLKILQNDWKQTDKM